MLTPRILVVEDEGIIALHLRRQLMRLGYEVPAAVADGKQALREVDASPPDLVLMDIVLEGKLDGIATAARIPTAYHIPVIYLTAHSDDATLARASVTNPYGYLLKPFSERELHAMIQMTLARCRSERASQAAQERRRRDEKMTALGDLAGGVADNFDELLTVIYDQLEALGEHAIEHPAMAAPIDEAFSEAIDKERHVRHLLTFSGRRELTIDTVSVNDLVPNVTSELRRTLDRSILILVTLPERLWNVRTNANQLANALSILAMNARDAMPDGGRLTIDGQNVILEQDRADESNDVTPGHYVLLTVADTGTGMTDEVIERAFEPYFTTRPDRDGLGLSFVFGFIRQSGGHISIGSQPGQGTTVKLWLPAAANAVAATEDSATARSPVTRLLPLSDDATTKAWQSIARRAGRRLQTTERRRDRPDRDQQERELSSTVPRYDALPLAWQRSGHIFFASLQSNPAAFRYRLIVEQLPRGRVWDWAVWRVGETPRQGHASSVVSAMAAAEDEAKQWALSDSLPD